MILPQSKLLIAEHAVRLRGAAPADWTAFLDALALAVADETAGAMAAPPDNLTFVAKGRALALADLHKLLNDAPQSLRQSSRSG